MTGAHAFLAPSAAPIWAADGGCRAYPRMAALYPQEDSEESREGTAAHWYATETLQSRLVVVGDVAPNGYPVDKEMIDCGALLIDDVRAVLATWPSAVMHVEQVVAVPIVNASNWGTPDVVVIDVSRKAMYLWDYKYGHRFVDAAGNLQLLDYAAGKLAEFAPCADWPNWAITLSVVQPRNYSQIGPVREWNLTGRDLLDVYVPQLFEAAREATGPDAAMTTGEHCRDCSARFACPALAAAKDIALDVSLKGAPVELTPVAVGLELRLIDDALKRLEARRTGLEAQALGILRGGAHVPFYALEYASGREKWTVPVDEVVAFGDLLGADLRAPVAALTPGQARKEIAKTGIDPSVISAYADKPRGALRLGRIDDQAVKLAFS